MHEKKTLAEKKAPRKASDIKKLSDSEVARLKPDIVEFFTWTSEHLDKFIQATTRKHEEVEIWSTLDEIEIEILVDVFMERGKKSERVAQTIRQISTFNDKLRVAIILTPRMVRTAQIYLERGIGVR